MGSLDDTTCDATTIPPSTLHGDTSPAATGMPPSYSATTTSGAAASPSTSTAAGAATDASGAAAHPQTPLLESFLDLHNLARRDLARARDAGTSIATFSGDSLKFKSFMTAFHAFHGDSTDNSAKRKLHLLASYLSDTVVTLIEDCLDSDDHETAYREALHRLTATYGNPEMILQVLLRTAETWPKIRSAEDFLRLATFIRTAKSRTSGLQGALASLLIIKAVTPRFPDHTVSFWHEQALTLEAERPPTLDDLLAFVLRRAEIERRSETTEARGQYGGSGPSDSRSPSRDDHHGRSSDPGRSRDRGGNSMRYSPSREPTSPKATSCFNIQTKEVVPLQKYSKSRKCSYCNSKDHWLSFCPTFRPLSAQSREEWIIDHLMCRKCGECHVGINECPVKTVCLMCPGDHVTALHGNQ